MKQDYKRYNYRDNVGLVTGLEQFEDYLNGKLSNITVDTDIIEESVKKGMDDSISKIEDGLDKVNENIENAKNEIIENENCHHPCICNLATKQDIQCAVRTINNHTDEKFDSIDFQKQFSDLNEQIKELNNA